MQDRLTHIPFLISGNNKSLEIRDEFIEAPLDLYPTILSQSGIEPLEHLSGYDLFKYKAKKENYCISESLFKKDGEFALRNKEWFYSINCGFDYMRGKFDFNLKKGEWLFKRDNKSKKILNNFNFINNEKDLSKKFYNIAKKHYNRKKYFSNKDIIPETKNYQE